MANVFSSNPIYIDTDTTVGLGTNWKGSSPTSGFHYTGGIGIRPIQILITPLGATTAGFVVINEINSVGQGTGPVLFKAAVPTAALGAGVSQSYTEELANSGWHDFILTGAAAANVSVEISYRV